MLKKALVFSLLGTCVVTSSFASNLLHMATVGHKKSHSDVTLKGQIKNYTDFSGTWTGVCSYSDKPETWVIENNANYIAIGDDSYGIGTFISESETDKNTATDAHVMYNRFGSQYFANELTIKCE